MFWLAIGALVSAWVCYSLACIYIVYISKLAAFDECRENVKNSKKHRNWFWTCIFLGIGPNYFMWSDFKQEWKYIENLVQQAKKYHNFQLTVYYHFSILRQNKNTRIQF